MERLQRELKEEAYNRTGAAGTIPKVEVSRASSECWGYRRCVTEYASRHCLNRLESIFEPVFDDANFDIATALDEGCDAQGMEGDPKRRDGS